MKIIYLTLLASLTTLQNLEAMEETKQASGIDRIINYKGREYVVRCQDATYPQMVKDLTHTFTALKELGDLFQNFKEEMKSNPDISLGTLETVLKPKIQACEQVFPLLIEFRKFDRPKRVEGVIEEVVKIPQLTTVDIVRKASDQASSSNQQVITKTTFILTPENLTKLAQKKGEKDKDKDKDNSNQWQYLEDLSKQLGNLSFTFNCNTRFIEGGAEDPTQTLSLVDASVSKDNLEEVLSAYEEKMLIGPNAAAFTYAYVKKVIGVFVYAPKGETFPEIWGTGSTIAANQYWDREG